MNYDEAMTKITDLLQRDGFDEQHISLMMNVIKIQQEEIKHLRDALRPFAECNAGSRRPSPPETQWLWTAPTKQENGINLKHILDARAAYAASAPMGGDGSFGNA